ncbi:uncharacterized protein RCC_05226 [Ramularia collo-cygni]|uniref:HAUS augmin-like complex subunit 6 N-terminal domain-containing protein n=1 Tax=Ramularia collo-cygni TaxID=112498 RepID=A0A2D3UVR5_9PEZI|nr:uncharacterized protein RCC_05226 [Ramularia collo-cygni]CZT19378.1 uncharacterized protein RCC_05226 [Ramularia collo-cygni]
MERSASSASNTSNAAHRQHKRVDSRIAHAPSTASLLVRNLRLLDLDTRSDWPAITPASFGNQDARTRMRCAEWALFQLFRIYDPATTADKLQPFFPPLEPLQSINLRAALYRCLNELKRDGVLGRETVLRKTMLDDCQGDKFFEVCLTFSATVLQKARVDGRNEAERPVAQRIATSQSLGKRQRESMLPLAIAHKAALSKVLAQRDHKRQAYANFGDLLSEKQSDLEQRKIRIAEQRHDPRDNPPNQTFAQDVLEKRWVGSNELRTALIDGDSAAGGDGVFTKSFEALWQATEQNRLFSQCTADTGILEDLEQRTRQQRRRLQKWQNFHQRLMISKSPKKSDFAPKDIPLRFDQHRGLNLRDMADEPSRPPPPSKKSKSVTVAKYDDILTTMREELRMNAAKSQGSPTKATPQAKRPVVKRHSLSQDSSAHPPSELNHQRSHSQAAAPVRPGIHKRFSSRSRSYHQPKVISQREILPLKSEIFSPLATKRLSSGSSSSPRSASVVSHMDDASPGARMDDILEATSRRIRQDNELTAAMEASMAGGTSSNPSRSNSGNNSPTFRKVSYDARDSGIELSSKPSVTPGRSTARPNLADRTRMSMAFKSSDDFTSIIPGTEQRSPEKPETPMATEVPPELERRSTLQERTRQSIISLPIVPQKKPTHARSRTSAFPVNQFETPQKEHRRSTLAFANDITPSQRRDLTPREELFDQDAEYASVFKARPKIALSPVLSPCVDNGGDLMESEASPLVAVGDRGL